MSWSYRPSLDGLRTLAMYLIVLFHANVAWAQGTFIAVNLFFVLSGYLVTNVVLNEIDKTGTLRLSVFYARRVRRLLPAALVAIVGISLLFLLVFPVSRRLALVGDAQSALLYVANWRFIDQAADYFATDVDKSPFLHFWTLGIEEQFYVVFPLVLLLLAKFARRWVMMAGLGVFLVLSLASQLYWARVDDMHAYFGTDARLYQLVAGCMLAVGFRYWSVHLSPRLARVTALTGLGGFLVLSFAFADMSQPVRGIWGTLACVLLVAGLMEAEEQPLGRLMSRPIPVYLGKVSYATYLWHWPAILAIKEVLNVSPITLAVMAAVISTAMAAASAELLEIPIRSSKKLDRFKWPTVVVGVTTSVLVAVSVVPTILESERRPALASAAVTPDQPAPEAPTRDESGSRRAQADVRPEGLPESVDWKQIDADKGDERSCEKNAPAGCTVVEGSGPHVLVIGDSHARMMSEMFTKLAKERDFTLSLNIVAGCNWQENLKNVQSAPARQEQCTKARVGWYDEVLPKLDPDVVILTQLPRDRGHWEKDLEQRDGGDLPLPRAILKSTKQTLRKIDRVADSTVILESLAVPRNFEPNECLSSTKDAAECSFPAPTENRVSDGIYVTEGAQRPNVFTANINPAFCPAKPVCHAVVDGTVAFRDSNHVTADFATKQRTKVWRIIRRSGAFERSESA